MTIPEALIERVRNLTGPDREVDALIANAIGWKYFPGNDDGLLALGLPCWTASVDACLALIEQKLPGWSYTITRKHCELRHPKLRAKDVQGWAQTAQAAILLALFHALSGEDNAHQ